MAEICIDSSYHVLQLLAAGIQPALRAKDVGILSPDALRAANAKEVLTNLGATRNKEAIDDFATWWYDFENQRTDWWPHSQAFADHSLKIRELLRLRP